MTVNPTAMQLHKNTLRTIAPYGLLLAPALLWLALSGGSRDGFLGQSILETAALYFAFGGAALVMRKLHPGTAGLIGGLVLLIFSQVSEVPTTGNAELRVAYLHLSDTVVAADEVAADVALRELDFISFRDSGEAHMQALSCALESAFPYTFHCVDAQDSGVAVFSRYPLAALQVEWWAEKPHISGKVMHPQGPVTFLTGGGPDSIRSQTRMQASAQHLQNQSGPKIMLDAFLEAPLHETIATFKHHSGLQDGRHRLVDIHPEILELIPDSVDYIFHSPEINCQEFHRLETPLLGGVAGIYRFSTAAAG